MSKSARTLLTEPTTVRVSNVHQVTELQAVISYIDADHEHIDDLFDVLDASVMETLLLVPAGKLVDATLAPPAGADGHPACTAATVVEA